MADSGETSTPAHLTSPKIQEHDVEAPPVVSEDNSGAYMKYSSVLPTPQALLSKRNLLPVLIVPGFMSSGLEVKRSSVGDDWLGKRVWINLVSLGFNKLRTGGALSVNESLRGTDRFSEEMHEEYQRQYRCKSTWLQHMSLMDDMCTERDGIEVRPIEGLLGVDYLIPGGALREHTSYVFAPVIKALRAVGYNDDCLDAAPYDWRLPPSLLEERDGYFTNTMRKVERLYEKNGNTPVVLLCHSLGCKTAHYFFNFVLAAYKDCGGGREWLDKHIHTYMPVGSPTLGAPKTVRASVDGDKMGLDTFLSDEEGLILGRSLGSVPWLIPSDLPLSNAPTNVVMRREGSLHVTVSDFDSHTLFRGREDCLPKFRLCLVFDDETLMTEYKHVMNARARFAFSEHFVFAAPPPRQNGKAHTGNESSRLQIILQEPGLVAKTEKTRKSGLYYSWLCCPVRLALGCLFCIIRYVLCLPCTLLGLTVKTITNVTLRSADLTAAALGSARVFASSAVVLLPATGSRETELSMDVLNVHPEKRAWFSSPFRRPRMAKVTIRVKWTPPGTEIHPSIACSPIASVSDEGLLQVRHKKKNIQYEPVSGYELLRREGLTRFFRTVRDMYDSDPIGPRSTSSEDPPPVKRIKAIYGINLPTEVGAVYRNNSLIQEHGKVQKLHRLDTAASLSSRNGGYKIEHGIILETKNTPQTISGQAHEGLDSLSPKVVHRSGDGTVPYWSLQHCRTWQGPCDVSVTEIDGAPHREILAHPKFHRILVDYVKQR